jgi:hypothetical protein
VVTLATATCLSFAILFFTAAFDARIKWVVFGVIVTMGITIGIAMTR